MTSAQVMPAFAAFPRLEVIHAVALSSSASMSTKNIQLSMGHMQVNWVRYWDEGSVGCTIKLTLTDNLPFHDCVEGSLVGCAWPLHQGDPGRPVSLSHEGGWGVGDHLRSIHKLIFTRRSEVVWCI